MQWAHHENYVFENRLAPETRPISFAESEGDINFLFPDTQGSYLNDRGKKRIGCEVVEILRRHQIKCFAHATTIFQRLRD